MEHERPAALALETIHDIERLIDARVRESLTLDYKRSAAINDSSLGRDIPKDVSAFANSEGGVLVYGVVEEANEPKHIDSGVDSRAFSRERIEQSILSGIKPRIAGLKISEIPLSSERSLFVVAVAKSFRTPHQAPDGKYYRRRNFTSAVLDDYEIADLRARRTAVPPLVNADLRIRGAVLVELVIENVGEYAAEDVAFAFEPPVKWHDGDAPGAISGGMRALPRGRRMVYLYQTLQELMRPGTDAVAEFDLAIQYTHPMTGARTAERFHLNALDYLGSQLERGPAHELAETLAKKIDRVSSQLEKIQGSLSALETLADHTGLSLSVTTLRNVQRLLRGVEDLERLPAQGASAGAFREVLGVDLELSYRLAHFFTYERNNGKALLDVPGVTEELRQALERHFKL